MKKVTLFGSVISAAIVAATTGALAAGTQHSGIQQGDSGSVSGWMMSQAAPATPGTETDAATPSAPEEPSAAAPAMPAETAAQPPLPPEELVGKNVVNAQEEKIGEVVKIVGAQVIVSVGGFLGIGTHHVALDWKQLKAIGTGDDMTVQTMLTKDEIKNMAAYTE